MIYIERSQFMHGTIEIKWWSVLIQEMAGALMN